MRRFWLKNEIDVWDLTSNEFVDKKSFLAYPQGLGIKVKIDSFEVDRAFFIEGVKIEDSEISGTLYFKDYDQFEKFTEFTGYIETTKPLRLYYSTKETVSNYEDEWYKLVLIKEITKGEIDSHTGSLICPIKFEALSRWKKDQKITLELAPFGEPLVYPYIYPYYYGGQNNMAVEIDNTGNLPTSCEVKIEAETDTPLFRIIQNGEVVEQAKYNVYIRPGSYAVINSDAANQEASLYTELEGGSVHREDIYYLGERDYTYSNFINIPSGKSLFLFTANNSHFGKVTLRYSLQKELI
jgi:hypothetical protein